jgi:hypothetical protein
MFVFSIKKIKNMNEKEKKTKIIFHDFITSFYILYVLWI